jgi:hypothetical protein
MALKKPLANYSGTVKELASGDIIAGQAAVALTDAATVAIDATQGQTRFTLESGSSRTLGAPGAGYSLQPLVFAMKNTGGGSITLTLTTGSVDSFRFTADITGLTATPAGKTDYLTFLYHAADQRWDVVGYVKG